MTRRTVIADKLDIAGTQPRAAVTVGRIEEWRAALTPGSATIQITDADGMWRLVRTGLVLHVRELCDRIDAQPPQRRAGLAEILAGALNDAAERIGGACPCGAFPSSDGACPDAQPCLDRTAGLEDER